MKGTGRGGRREGSGRPKVDIKRKHRALHFFDGEWETIRQKAAERGMSPREYLFTLVELDNRAESAKSTPGGDHGIK